MLSSGLTKSYTTFVKTFSFNGDFLFIKYSPFLLASAYILWATSRVKSEFATVWCQSVEEKSG